MSRVSGKLYFLYILWSKSGCRFYIGISEDPHARLAQHNEGRSMWTARNRPWELVHVESYRNYTEARKREICLKKQKGGVGFYALTGLDPSRFRTLAMPTGS
jgi:predicted GIY-YIG superfamily endonuclease